MVAFQAKFCSLTGDVWASVVVDNAYALAQHSSSPVWITHRSFFSVSQYLSAFIGVLVGIKSTNIPLSRPKIQLPDFTGRLCLFEFSRLGPPLAWLFFGLRCKVERPGLVTCDNRVQKVVLFVCIATKKFAERINSLPFVVIRQHSWYPSCAHLPILQLFR